MVITFGRDVKVLQYYSTDYKEIVKCVGKLHFLCLEIEFEQLKSQLCDYFYFEDNLTCEGGSPLRRGIQLCMCGIEPGRYLYVCIHVYGQLKSYGHLYTRRILNSTILNFYFK